MTVTAETCRRLCPHDHHLQSEPPQSLLPARPPAPGNRHSSAPQCACSGPSQNRSPVSPVLSPAMPSRSSQGSSTCQSPLPLLAAGRPTMCQDHADGRGGHVRAVAGNSHLGPCLHALGTLPGSGVTTCAGGAWDVSRRPRLCAHSLALFSARSGPLPCWLLMLPVVLLGTRQCPTVAGQSRVLARAREGPALEVTAAPSGEGEGCWGGGRGAGAALYTVCVLCDDHFLSKMPNLCKSMCQNQTVADRAHVSRWAVSVRSFCHRLAAGRSRACELSHQPLTLLMSLMSQKSPVSLLGMCVEKPRNVLLSHRHS